MSLRRFVVRELREHEVMPAFFGVAWVDFVSNRPTCLPLPLNLVAAFARMLYLAARYPRPIAADPRAAYRQGRRDAVLDDPEVRAMQTQLADARALLRELAREESRAPEPGSLVDRADNWLYWESVREQQFARFADR